MSDNESSKISPADAIKIQNNWGVSLKISL